VNAVLNGDRTINPCLAVSWEQHVSGFMHENCLIVGYERLLAEPPSEAQRICEYLGLSRSTSEIQAAIGAQDIQARKCEFEKRGDARKAKFMREGRAGQWREHFEPRQRAVFESVVARYADRFGFTVR